MPQQPKKETADSPHEIKGESSLSRLAWAKSTRYKCPRCGKIVYSQHREYLWLDGKVKHACYEGLKCRCGWFQPFTWDSSPAVSIYAKRE
jgi:DNA-directed RNA polymerase subunit RPC12/RpoP